MRVPRKPETWSGSVERNIRKAIVNGRKVYLVQMGHAGKGQRRQKLCATLEEAVAIKRQWAAEGVPVAAAPAAPAAPEATVEDGLRQYGANLIARGKSPARVLQLIPALRRQYPDFLTQSLATVSVDSLWAFRRQRAAAGIKDGTIIRDLRALRAAFKHAFGPAQPFVVSQDVFPKEDALRVRELTDQQVRRALVATAEPFRTMVQLAATLLMRQGDLLRLKRAMIRWDEATIELPRTKRGPRQVALGKYPMKLLRAHCATLEGDSEYVFPNPQGMPYSRVHVSRVWRRAVRHAAGRFDFTFHDLKHHGAMRALADGATFPELQALGHWATPKMVNRYATASSVRLRSIQDRIAMGGRR
jgi:integrase